jgi:hypothetical protein
VCVCFFLEGKRWGGSQADARLLLPGGHVTAVGAGRSEKRLGGKGPGGRGQ